jgi:hypothetical protein
LNGTGGNANYVDNSGTYVLPHSGTYCALLGEAGSLAYLSQTFPTVAGQKYLLSLWLYNQLKGSSANPNEFSVSWNGSTLYDKVNVPQITSWSNIQFVVTASAGSTVLQIGGRNDKNYLGLDDVSLTPISAPTITQQPVSQTNFIGSNVIFTAAASGTASLIYHWCTNGVNLVNNAVISGATSNVLTLTGITAANAENYMLVVTNAYGSVTSSVVTLTVTLGSPPQITSVATQTDGSFALNFAGMAGVSYILETTTNLLFPEGWQPVATNAAVTNGVLQFTDPQATNFPQRFYRLKLAP